MIAWPCCLGGMWQDSTSVQNVCGRVSCSPQGSRKYRKSLKRLVSYFLPSWRLHPQWPKASHEAAALSVYTFCSCQAGDQVLHLWTSERRHRCSPYLAQQSSEDKQKRVYFPSSQHIQRNAFYPLPRDAVHGGDSSIE